MRPGLWRGRFAPGLRPGVEALRSGDRRLLIGEAVAGLTVAAYLVPQVLAYAEVAGLAPVAGLWAAAAAITAYLLLGSSRQLSIGPESTTALMTAIAVAPLAAGDPTRYTALAAALALMVAAVCLVARAARLGFLSELLSRPVLFGYLAGIALVMVSGQLDNLTGVPVEGDGFIAEIRRSAPACTRSTSRRCSCPPGFWPSSPRCTPSHRGRPGRCSRCCSPRP